MCKLVEDFSVQFDELHLHTSVVTLMSEHSLFVWKKKKKSKSDMIIKKFIAKELGI